MNIIIILLLFQMLQKVLGIIQLSAQVKIMRIDILSNLKQFQLQKHVIVFIAVMIGDHILKRQFQRMMAVLTIVQNIDMKMVIIVIQLVLKEQIFVLLIRNIQQQQIQLLLIIMKKLILKKLRIQLLLIILKTLKKQQIY